MGLPLTSPQERGQKLPTQHCEQSSHLMRALPPAWKEKSRACIAFCCHVPVGTFNQAHSRSVFVMTLAFLRSPAQLFCSMSFSRVLPYVSSHGELLKSE